MKRKSILMTIVMALFASVSWGQTWSPDISGTTPAGADTIYFCVSSDSLYPIEFGYDVFGKQLHPSFGNWELLAKSSSSLEVIDYNFGAAKNGGAGNAFKAVGSGIGGIIFQYTATDDQCGIGVGDKFWAYVFILPQEDKVISPVDTFVCYDENKKLPTDYIEIKFADIFKTYTDLYTLAGFDLQWNDGSALIEQLRYDSIAKYTLRDTLVISPKTGFGAGYTCGDSIPLLFKITVDSIVRDTVGKSRTICAVDTLDPLGNRNPLVVFQRTSLPNGAYYDAASGGNILTNIKGWTTAEQTAGKKLYYYRYNDCETPPNSHLIVDTLKVINELPYADGNVGIDTVNYCRIPGSLSIVDVFNSDAWYLYQPVLNPDGSDSYWSDRGIYDKDLSAVIPPNTDFGTSTSYPSLVGHTVNFDIMKSSIGYYYKWNVDNSVHECFVGQDGTPGNGTLVIILQDPFVAQDYTAQLCVNSYASNAQFNLNEYTGLTVQWDGPYISATKDYIEPNGLLKSTYKYKYDVPPVCGAGGKGVLYVKVTDKVKTPVSKNVKYCIDKLPGAINLNDVLGVAVDGLKWKAAAGTTIAGDSFNGTVLDVGLYFSNPANTATTLKFEFDAPPGDLCGISTSTTLTLEFTGTL
jgi:hypothetical protein